MCERTSASPTPPIYNWPVNASANETLRQAASRMELSPGQIDERLKELKCRIFNEKIQEALATIQPIIATFEASAPAFAGKIGFELKNLAPHLRGDLTYTRVHTVFQKLVDRHDTSSEFSTLRGVVFNLSHIVPQEGQKKRIPSKAQIKETLEAIAPKLTSLQKTWPTEIAECQRILRQNNSFESVIAVYQLLEPLYEREKDYLVKFSQLLLDIVREGSTTAFAKYEKIVIRNLTASCGHCHKQDTWHTPGQFVFTLKKCAGCKAVFYCSQECQRADWPTHKLVCQHKAKRP